MAPMHAGRPLKRWRYVAVWTRDITVYGASAWTGPVAQEFWAVLDRRDEKNVKFYERTRNIIPGKVKLTPGRMYVKDRTKNGDAMVTKNLEQLRNSLQSS